MITLGKAIDENGSVHVNSHVSPVLTFIDHLHHWCRNTLTRTWVSRSKSLVFALTTMDSSLAVMTRQETFSVTLAPNLHLPQTSLLVPTPTRHYHSLPVRKVDQEVFLDATTALQDISRGWQKGLVCRIRVCLRVSLASPTILSSEVQISIKVDASR